MITVILTAAQVRSMERSLARTPSPPGWVAIPFPFNSLPTNEDGSPCFESDSSNRIQGAQISVGGESVGYGIVRAIQRADAPPWDLMADFDFPMEPAKYYLWIEPSRGVFAGEPLPATASLAGANLLMQAILVPAGETPDGTLIKDVALPWFEIIKLLERDPDALYRLDWRKFEELVAGGYEREGYKVTLTPRSADYGRDVIATKDGVGCIRIYDSIKKYAPGRPVKADDVRAMLGVLTGAGNVSKGIITTTSSFAPGIEKDPFLGHLMPYRLELRPRDVLIPWLRSLASKKGS
jgi:restriction system protein